MLSSQEHFLNTIQPILLFYLDQCIAFLLKEGKEDTWKGEQVLGGANCRGSNWSITAGHGSRLTGSCHTNPNG